MHNQPTQQEDAEQSQETAYVKPSEHEGKFGIGDKMTFYVDGKPIEAEVVQAEDVDGVVVQTSERVNGHLINQYTREELDALTTPPQQANDNADAVSPKTPEAGAEVQNETGEEEKSPDELPAFDGDKFNETHPADEIRPQEEQKPNEENNAVDEASTSSKIPQDESGEYDYMQAEPSKAWAALLEQTEGDADMAREVAQSMLNDKVAELEEAQKQKPKEGKSVAEKIAARKEHKANIERIESEIERWQQILSQSEQQPTTEETKPKEETPSNHIADVSKKEEETTQQENIKLSDEVDENGRQFVLNSEGNLAFGEITEDTGLTAAPILLSEGMITNRATNDGYGLAHIEARHGEEIRKAGYKSVLDFIEQVAKNYDVIKEGNMRDGRPTYRLMLTDKHNNTLMVELSGDGTFWNINTAGIFKTSYGRKNREVYNRHTTVKQSAETTETSQDAEQSDTQAPSRMNVPTTSESEDTKSKAEGQEKSEESKETSLSEQISTASAEVNTDPTDAQKEAGNFKKGHVQVGTFDITIEQPQGSIRRGKDENGKKWESKMHNTYGYFRGTEGVDGDHIDVFLSNDIDGWNGRKVFVVDQYNPDGTFDEHKVMLGFNDIDEAKSDYLANYEKGWENGRRIDVTPVSLEDFEKWIGSSHRKTKAFAEYAGVKKEDLSASEKEGQEKEGVQDKKEKLNGSSAPIQQGKTGDEKGERKEKAKSKGYSITPSTYTNKQGKTSNVTHLSFDRELDSEQTAAIDRFAGEKMSRGRFAKTRGWRDRKNGGWIFRNEDDARAAAEMVGDKQAVKDNQPLSLDDVRNTTGIEEADAQWQKATERQKQDDTKDNEQKNEGKFNLVSDERMEELKRRLREKLRGQMNVGVDPEMLSIGIELAVGYVDRGVKKFSDFAEKMIGDMGDVIRPYLKAFYNGMRDMPEITSKGYDKELTPYEEVRSFDVAGFDKPSTGIVEKAKMMANEERANADAEKANQELRERRNKQAKEQTEEKVGERQGEAETNRKFAMAVMNDMLSALENKTKPYRSIVDLRKRAKQLGMEVDSDGRTDILLQELVEDGLVRAAREVAERYGSDSKEAYEQICKLYDMQPTIAARSSNRIKMQQYSTPLPMAWNATRFAMMGKENGKILEPTAGNGMLVFNVPAKQVHVNELDETRLGNLEEQGFDRVTNQDATKPFEGGRQYDVVIANPPFGKSEARWYDGKMISGLDPQITLNALASMKDDGRAAIIIGGNMEYGENGAIKSMQSFFTYLYDHYNVKGVVDMGGKLYAKQGTTFPTRMILIDGRRSEEDRAQSAVYPPIESQAVRKAESFEDLYDIVDELINLKDKTNGTEILRSQQGQLLSDAIGEAGRSDGRLNKGQHRENDVDGRGRHGGDELGTGVRSGELVLRGEHREDIGDDRTARRTDRDTRGRSGGNTEPVVRGVEDVGVRERGVGLDANQDSEKKRTLTEEKLPYRPHNSAFSLESVAPAAMVEAMDNVLTQIEEEHGSIDSFVTEELGYDSVEEAHNALAAEQMDSVAMAIYQMQRGRAMIIGDQTGVGKGRQMAALIRWAHVHGKKPIFITQKADLFSDIYRDLVDIGSGDLVPFIFNSPNGENKGEMVDANGKVVYRGLPKSKMDKVLASGELPDEYDYAVLTYSQVNTGDDISQAEAKKGGIRVKASKSEGKATPKATFLRAIARNNFLLLDESHTAAGASNTGAYLQSIVRGSAGVTFASATFAKRPDTMPMYALRTAMSEANVDANELIAIIEKGGVTLQEIMSRALTDAGQMVRRERDMTGVVTDWKTIDDPETVRRARENYDSTIVAFNAIIKFQDEYIVPFLERLSRELAVMAASAGMKKGTKKMGIENTPFASKAYNYTKQLMLALKTDAIVDEVEKEIKAGRHPVIALESTMESSIKEYNAGEVITEPTFAASLLRGLESVMQYTVKKDGAKFPMPITPKQLGLSGEKAYYELQDFIRKSTSGVFVSPLDAMIEKLQERGYKVGELTGRNMYVERNEKGELVARKRTDKDKKRMQREFNNGQLDVLILNKSASTGISLHASEKFGDQRQRTMIIAQPLSDINDYMQMIGRIDRTGQVHRGYYINLGLPVPAENRFLMMLSTKLKSLNANTTTSQESESTDVEAPDLLNKYGSQVIIEYLRDNPDVYEKMGSPLSKSGDDGKKTLSARELDDYVPQEDDARKITGYVALLSTKEQEDFYNDVTRRYAELIKYLDDTGNNDLKITVMPLRAKMLDKRVSSEGRDPDGNNPFAQNSYVEKVEMDVLRKPMKADDVRKTIQKVNNGKSGREHLQDIVSTVRSEDDARLEAENARYEKAKQRAKEDIAKQTEKINGQKKRTEEEKVQAISDYTNETNENIEAKHEDNVERIKNNQKNFFARLGFFEVGKSYLVPENLESLTFDFASPAIFCGFKAKDNKITPSTTLAVFATLDGRRRVEVKLSQLQALGSIRKMTNDNWDAARSTSLDNWDSKIPKETRKEGYIMTGNILQAISDTQNEKGGFPGQLISYSDIDGNIHDGVLMPDKWTPSLLRTSGVPINSRMQQIKDYKSVQSQDGSVVIEGSKWANEFYLTVPKTKKAGAKYFENEVLLDAARGNFYPYRGKLRADIDANKIEQVVNELAKLGVKVVDEAKAEDLRFRDEVDGDGAVSSSGVDGMRERAVELGRELGADVDVVSDVSEITDPNPEVQERKRRAKGWYDAKTGRVVINLAAHSDMADVEQTLLHEIVGHRGLRGLVGHENFNGFLDGIYEHASDVVREGIDDIARRKGCSKRVATEEYMSGLAEGGFADRKNAGLWQQIRQWFGDMLSRAKIKLNFSISDNELRYLLWRSHELSRMNGREGVVGRARDLAMQNRLGVGNGVRKGGESAVDSYDGDLETLFRDADSPVDYERALIRDSYERRLKDVWFQSREALQDGMLSLKETMKDIWRSAGKKFSQITDIPDYANPYIGQNRLSSRNAAEVRDFKRRLFRPLLREVGRLTGFSADGRAKLTDYMMAKHGLERNKVMAERDAKAAYEAEKLKDPNTTKKLADFVAEYRKKDYSGLTSLTGLDDVAAAEAEAKNMVADYEANHDTANLWARTKAVTDAIVEKQYDSGYINSITRNAILNMYDNYIPLRGFEDKTAEDVYSYMKHSNSAFNAPIKTARGRKSKADDPFANMLAMAESGIMRGNRNKLVKLPLLSLVLEHPTDLISVSDVWFVLFLVMCKF